MSTLVAPSILAADFGHLADAVKMVNRSSASWIHCDVMDGNFVPNISFGLPVLRAIHEAAEKPLDVHLMIEEPARYIQAFKDAGADHLTIHIEADRHADRTLRAIRQAGMKAGIALNPGTPVGQVVHLLELADIVLLMTVNPGFGGQAFIPYVLDKVAAIKQLIVQRELHTQIEIDGGVNDQTGLQLAQVGADVLVAGSYVFKADDPLAAIDSINGLSGETKFA